MPYSLLPDSLFQLDRWCEVEAGRWSFHDHITLGELRGVLKIVERLAANVGAHGKVHFHCKTTKFVLQQCQRVAQQVGQLCFCCGRKHHYVLRLHYGSFCRGLNLNGCPRMRFHGGSDDGDMNTTVFPSYLDVHHAQSVNPSTLLKYKTSLTVFVKYLVSVGRNPGTVEELDACVVDYRQTGSLTRAKLEGLIAALEFFLPQSRGGYAWAKRVAKGLAIVQPVKHTCPLTLAPGKLIAVTLCGQGFPRLGAGLLVQILTGLRPGELLQLRREHVLLPTSKVSRFLFRLGAKRGTKLKREQATWLDKDRDVAVSTILHRWIDSTSAGALLVDCSYDEYRKQFQVVSKQLGLPFVFTPHSPRAGFASEAISLGEDPGSVRLRGRWQSETSFRIYVDVISAAMVDVLDSLCTFRPMLAVSEAVLLDVFVPKVFSHA